MRGGPWALAGWRGATASRGLDSASAPAPLPLSPASSAGVRRGPHLGLRKAGRDARGSGKSVCTGAGMLRGCGRGHQGGLSPTDCRAGGEAGRLGWWAPADYCSHRPEPQGEGGWVLGAR